MITGKQVAAQALTLARGQQECFWHDQEYRTAGDSIRGRRRNHIGVRLPGIFS